MGGSFTVEPIGFVVGGRDEVVDDDWGSVATIIRLVSDFDEDAVLGLDAPTRSTARRCST